VFVVIHTVTEVLPIFYLFSFSPKLSSHSFCARATFFVYNDTYSTFARPFNA
jgi:hypothetical protein